MCQLNWWLPIYDFAGASSMAFHPRYFAEPIPNGSRHFNYYEWNADQRKHAAQHIKSDTRWQPRAEEPLQLDPDIRFVCPTGGTILFSGAQLHSTVANTTGRTRFSMDFRTVSLVDLVDGRAAPNADSFPTGTSLRDFVRCGDRSPVPDSLVARYDLGPAPDAGILRFEPAARS
jgi:hypothetical protein